MPWIEVGVKQSSNTNTLYCRQTNWEAPKCQKEVPWCGVDKIGWILSSTKKKKGGLGWILGYLSSGEPPAFVPTQLCFSLRWAGSNAYCTKQLWCSRTRSKIPESSQNPNFSGFSENMVRGFPESGGNMQGGNPPTGNLSQESRGSFLNFATQSQFIPDSKRTKDGSWLKSV